MRRLQSGQRWWAAEIALRALGLVLLGLCAASAAWLYRLVHQPPPHDPRPLEFLAATLSVMGWSSGCAFFFEGPGLFQLVPVPARYRRFTP